MEKQMQAERNKRATILTSEGEKEKQRLLSEGEKAAIVNKAEAAKQQAILRARVPSIIIITITSSRIRMHIIMDRTIIIRMVSRMQTQNSQRQR
jgi:regulator of protease activity HflC (stomatin/prohibitin superfamily)